MKYVFGDKSVTWFDGWKLGVALKVWDRGLPGCNWNGDRQAGVVDL